MTDATGIKARLKEWVAAKNGSVSAADIADDTPLMERRILTSLQIMDFILFLEDFSGNPISIDSLKPGSFENIQTIYTAFFGGGPNA